MPMWTMNLRGLSAGKDLAGVTQERPLPLKSRAQCVPHTLAYTACVFLLDIHCWLEAALSAIFNPVHTAC